MVKKLWILWFQGFENSPYPIKECLNSWKVHNRDSWDIIELTNKNIGDYVNITKIKEKYINKKITKIAFSDIIRIELLKRYGGLWVDSTTYCNQPLDNWLEQYTKYGFFAFELSGMDRKLSSWFLYANKNNYIVKKWHQSVASYTKKHNVIGTEHIHHSQEEWSQGIEYDHYFWFHYLFGDLYYSNKKFKCLWDKNQKINASKPHYIHRIGMSSLLTKQIKNEIDSSNTPLYKLSYKNLALEDGSKTVLSYLFNRCI